MSSPAQPLHPLRTVLTVFAGWKLLLFAIALGSVVGPSYDTSTELLLADQDGDATAQPALLGSVSLLLHTLALRLTRWDAIYFVQIARRGHVFEQEHAFASGMPMLMRGCVRLFSACGLVTATPDSASNGPPVAPAWVYALAGVVVATLAHLAAVLVLYALTLKLSGGSNRRHAATAGILHVLSPAGLFLSAPYAESAFALLSFCGYWCFARGLDGRVLARWMWLPLAGALFGVSISFRSNGLMNGVLFAGELLVCLQGMWAGKEAIRLGKLLPTILGGSLTGLGFVLPQYLGYLRYCSGASANGLEPRPWCAETIPSLYSYVESHYWNNGLFRYWTLSNLPLFALAAPMAALVLKSGYEAIRWPSVVSGNKGTAVVRRYATLVRCMAATQVILTVLLIFRHHVQIINRLSSAYPVWYWWVACEMASGTRPALARGITMSMAMYSMIQGVLYASFLPPA